MSLFRQIIDLVIQIESLRKKLEKQPSDKKSLIAEISRIRDELSELWKKEITDNDEETDCLMDAYILEINRLTEECETLNKMLENLSNDPTSNPLVLACAEKKIDENMIQIGFLREECKSYGCYFSDEFKDESGTVSAGIDALSDQSSDPLLERLNALR